MRHANAKHRATSDPSERHTVETGEWEANGLGVADVNGDFAGVGIGAGAVLTMKNIVAGFSVKLAEGDVGATLLGPGNRRKVLHLRLRFVIGRGDGKGEGVGRSFIIGVGGSNLGHRIGAGIEALDLNHSLVAFITTGRKFNVLGKVAGIGNGYELTRDNIFGFIGRRSDVLAPGVLIGRLDGEDGAPKALLGTLVNLLEFELECEVGNGVLDRLAHARAIRIVGVLKRNGVGVAAHAAVSRVADHGVAVKLGLVEDNNLGARGYALDLLEALLAPVDLELDRQRFADTFGIVLVRINLSVVGTVERVHLNRAIDVIEAIG